jgi:uncharacterized protein (TIGR03437 family)
MINRTCIFVGSSILFGVAVLAQDLPMIFQEYPYDSLPLFRIARGQIVTLWVRGLNVPPAVSKSDPLARELNGVYVLLEDGANNYSQKLPLLRIGTGECSGTCQDTNIVAQIPYDMPGVTPERVPYPTLTVYKNGKPGFRQDAFYTDAVPRILSTCMAALREDWPQNIGGQPCPPLVTRQDGSLVSFENRFIPGETITVYASGLGLTNPRVEAGTAVKQPTSTRINQYSRSYLVRVCYNCDYSPEGAIYSQIGPWFEPEYVGLAIGSAGIYQINIKTPLPPPEAAARSQDPDRKAVFYFNPFVSEEFSVAVPYRTN